MTRLAGRRRAVFAALCALLAGVGLLALALPRAVAGFLLLPGEPDVSRMRDLRPIGDAALARAIASREASLRWAEDGRIRSELALARLMLAERKPILRTDLDLLPIRGELLRSLALMPVNPYAWTRLAYLDYAVEGPEPGAAARVLPLAILTGPSEDRLYLLRAELGIRLWPDLQARDRQLVLRQTELAWDQDPFRTLAISRSAGRLDLLREALVASPDQQEILEKLIARGF